MQPVGKKKKSLGRSHLSEVPKRRVNRGSRLLEGSEKSLTREGGKVGPVTRTPTLQKEGVKLAQGENTIGSEKKKKNREGPDRASQIVNRGRGSIYRGEKKTTSFYGGEKPPHPHTLQKEKKKGSTIYKEGEVQRYDWLNSFLSPGKKETPRL